MESCFPCFTVNVLVDLRVIPVVTERKRLVPFNPMPTDEPTQLTNAAIDISPVMAVDAVRPVPTIIIFFF